MKIKKKWIVLFLLPSLLLFGFVYMASIAIVISTSFTNWRIGGDIDFTGLANYISLFKSDVFAQALKNNLVWIFLQSTIHVAIGVSFALAVSGKKWYNRFCQTSYMLPNIISNAALGMLFYNVFNPMYGPINKIIQSLGFENFNINWFADARTAFFAVTLTWLPFAAMVGILCLAELAAISNDIFEAAIIDGASPFQLTRYIKLPMLKNAIGTGAVLAASSMLQKMDILLMTTSGGPGNKTMNLPMLIYETALRDNNFGLANAQGVVLILVGLLSIAVVNRIFKMNESL